MPTGQLPLLVTGLLFTIAAPAQMRWTAVDSFNRDLPASVRVYRSTDSIEGKPNVAWYVSASLKDAGLSFDVDTTYKRRLTPRQYYDRNHAFVVVNGTFFSFQTNQNLNTVVKDGRAVSFNPKSVKGRGSDSTRQVLVFRSALGIWASGGGADVAWITPDTTTVVKASQQPVAPVKTMAGTESPRQQRQWQRQYRHNRAGFKAWPVETAIGGGPVLLQNGAVTISNNQELMFAGKAIDDRHPRTAMGYTADGRLIILVIQGRMKGLAEGASLIHEALILKDLGCIEALNLDGGGSSCLLVNGKETIKPSDGLQRPVPAVFLIKKR